MDLKLWQMPKNPRIFIDLARKATAARPDIVKNWERLAWRLIANCEYNQASVVLAEAVSKFPTEPQLQLILADAYYQARQFDLAHETLLCTPAVPTSDRETTIYRLELLMKNSKDGSRFATDTLTLDPTNMTALRVMGKATRKRGSPEIMIPVCQAALKHQPGHTQAIYELAVAYALLGRSDEARALIGIDRFITVTKVVTPPGYANAETFEGALASEIIGDPSLMPDPLDRATRGSLQTLDGLPHAGEHAISAVINSIRLSVDAFEADLPRALDHPFIKRRPKQASLNAWAIVYPGDGHQVAHIHATGWLSGVYFVSVPKTSGADTRNGCLVLGALDLEGVKVEPPWGIRDIKPLPGRLVLFPSYIPHATIPTRSTVRRICIAFNVNPI